MSEEFYNFAEDAVFDEEERQQVSEKLRRAREYAPSSRVQTDSYRYFQESQSAMLGAPYDVSKIPIDVLTQMKFDPMLMFGEHFITMPLLRARWHIESEDAQVAAFIDKALRKIYANYILERSQSHIYGFKPIVKRFQLEMPDWRYKDPAKSDFTIPVWESANVEALTWKHFVGLPSNPNICEPVFNARGDFNGIKYTPAASTNADGLSGQFNFTQVKTEDNGTRKIPGHLALWAVNQRHTVDGCSPPDELVLTNKGYVPISKLDSEIHSLAQFSSGKILRFNRKNGAPGHKFEVGSRQYEGDLVIITTPNGVTRVTPNHKLTVRWQEEIANKYAVYIMKKIGEDGENKYRIGIAKVSRTKAKQKTSGVIHRMLKEGADEAWIVDIFDTKKEACFFEQKWAYQYNIPDLTFAVKNHILEQYEHDALWNEFKNTKKGAASLLSDCGRDINYPLYTKGKNPKGGRGEFTVAACNLFEQMCIPTDPGAGQKAEWHNIKLDREYYEGLVYSLEVPPYNHYISNGNITQNSLWGFPRIGYAYRYWFSYWLRWAMYDRYFERKSDPPYIVYYPNDPLNGEVDANGVSMKTHALAIGDAAKSGGTIALPGDFSRGWDDRPTGNREWEVKELEIAGDLGHFVESFEYLDKMKIRALLIPDQALMGAGGATSNRNAAEQEIDMFMASEASEMEQIDDEINRYIIPDLVAANFPDRNVTATKVTTGFDDADIQTMMEIIRVVGQSDQNALKAVDFEGILEAIGIPSINHDEIVRREEKIREEIENANPEPIQPVPGEQAGVDEEGFYIQPKEVIKLSERENFAQDFPATKHYQDEEIVGIASRINQDWNSIYNDIYEDIANYLSSQQFSEETDSINFADDEARKLADRILEGWNFGTEKARGIFDRTKNRIREIIERAGRRELQRIRTNPDWQPDTEAVAEYLEERGLLYVKAVSETVKAEVASYLAEQIRQGKTGEEISQGVRDHFNEFPGWKADRLVRSEVRDAYNFATLEAGQQAGIKVVQAKDAQLGDTDAECIERNNQFYSIPQALVETLKEHPFGTLEWKLIPNVESVSEVTVEASDLEGEEIGFFDEETGTIYFSDEATEFEISEFRELLGELLFSE